MVRDLSGNRWVDALLRWRWPIFTLAIVLGVVAWPMAARLKLDRRLESLFRADDPSLAAYRELKVAFGGNAVAMLVYSDPDLFSREGLKRNRELGQRISSLKGVAGILSPAKINSAIEAIRPPSIPNFAGSEQSSPALANPDDAFAKRFDDIFAGYTHAANHRYASVVALLAADYDQATIESLHEVVLALRREGKEVGVVGEPVLLHDGFTLIEKDSARLAVWTVVLLSIVLLVSIRDLRFVGLAALVVFWTVLVTRAIAVAVSIQLSIVSSVLTAIVTVIAVASVLHMGVRYRTSRRRGATSLEAAGVTMSSLTVPIFWTCATDAVGFAALLFSHIRPVQDFGVMIAIASTAVLVAIVMFAPALMSIPFRMPRRVSLSSYRGPRVRRLCVRIATSFIAWRWTVSAVSLVVFVVLLVAVSSLETETSFLNNFRAESEIARAYNLVEREYGGAGVWDIVLAAPVNFSQADFDRVRELQTKLKAIEVNGVRLTKVLSIADVEAALAELPLLSFAPPEVRLSGMRLAMPAISDALLTKPDAQSARRLRIMLRSPEQLPAETKYRLIQQVQQAVQEYQLAGNADQVDPENLERASSTSVTGYYVLIATWVRQLVEDQWRCLIASGIFVWLLLVIACRSTRLATAALLPNLLPAFLVLAVVGIVGDKMNMGAAMIAAVSIGLSIDSSVHYLVGYQTRRRRGHDASAAAAHAAGAISFPVIAATFALVIGFSVLGTSEFVPTATFGILIAATLAVGTVINLTLLPAMVRLCEK